MEIILPKERNKVIRRDPRLFILYSAPKVGKTTLISTLDNNLILDLERGSDYLEALSVTIIGLVPPLNESEESKEKRIEKGEYYLHEVGREIYMQGRPYKFISVDTVTMLEDLILPLANDLYRNSPMGSNWGKLEDKKTNDPKADVRTLARGSGYYYLRLAFEETLNGIKKLADNIILIGHLRNSIVDKGGEEVASKELSLTGKIREITCGGADAIGYMYRGKKNELLINFKSSEEILCGARPAHLKGQIIKIADYDESSNSLVNIAWDKIYPDVFNK